MLLYLPSEDLPVKESLPAQKQMKITGSSSGLCKENANSKHNSCKLDDTPLSQGVQYVCLDEYTGVLLYRKKEVRPFYCRDRTSPNKPGKTEGHGK